MKPFLQQIFNELNTYVRFIGLENGLTPYYLCPVLQQQIYTGIFWNLNNPF